MKKFVVVILTIFMMCTSSISFAAGNNASSKKYDGESIFRGLFLGQGEVAKLFPAIWTKELLAKVDNKDSKALADELVSRVKKLDPQYLAQLEKAAYSKNQLQVKAALTKGQALINKALSDMQVSIAKDSKAGTGQGQCAWIFVYAAAVFAAAGAVTHAVVVTAGGGVAAYLVIVGEKYLWSADASDEDGSLKQDQFVDTVVKAFSN